LSGFFCIIFGTVSNVVAIRYGNLLLLASSSALTMIFNTILSVYILHENFTRWDLVAILLICLGSISCMFFSKTNESELTQAELLALFTSTGALIY